MPKPNIQVSNQRPTVLSPLYDHDYDAPFDPVKDVGVTFGASLRQPLIQTAPVQIQLNGSPVTDADIAQRVTDCCGDVLDADAEDFCKSLFAKTLTYYNPNGLRIQSVFAAQAAVKSRLPFPSPTVMYTPASDIIPTCREFLSGQCDPEKLFATFAFYGHVDTLGFYFVSNAAFDMFKQWLAASVQPVIQNMKPMTQQLLGDFQNLTLNDLTESIIVRNQDSDNNDPGDFARVILSKLLEYAKTANPTEFGIMPFAVGELFCPKTLLFINVEKHMHATARQIANEWDTIQKSMQMKPPIISNGKLMKLTGMVRNLQKIQAMAASAQTNMTQQALRSANIPFRSKPPRTLDIAKFLMRIMDKMADVNRSENSYKDVKLTYNKPNRRDPDDFNKQGKSVSTKYKPDIHLYIDTSGSISEDDYKQTVMACIYMAKKLNVNIYFNSFSHILSQCTKLHTKDKSVRQIYAKFQKVAKVSGGTDFDIVWDYIQQDRRRRREISICITDFEYTPKNRQAVHPKNLYYVPCSTTSWTSILHYADRYVKACAALGHDIRTKLLF